MDKINDLLLQGCVVIAPWLMFFVSIFIWGLIILTVATLIFLGITFIWEPVTNPIKKYFKFHIHDWKYWNERIHGTLCERICYRCKTCGYSYYENLLLYSNPDWELHEKLGDIERL